MVIKNFKTFENRGDEEDDPRQYKLELDDNGNYRTKEHIDTIKEYILSVPSGEVVFIDDKEFKTLANRKIVNYTYSFREKILNCYCFPDKEINNIHRFLDEMRGENKSGKIDFKQYEIRAKDFSDDMQKLLHRKYVVAYLPKNTGKDYYFIIIPDLKMNKLYYKNKIEYMTKIVNKLNIKYIDSNFSFVDRLNLSSEHIENIKYYGLPGGNI